MRPNSKKSSNYSILKDILSKSRRFKFPQEMDYIVIYTFLYKYCSDHLKNHYLMVLQDKEMTLDEAFANDYQRMMLKDDSLRLFGFFIQNPEAFLDEVMNNSYTDRFFLSNFFEMLPI